MSNDESKIPEILIGLALGVAVGSVVTLLLTHKSGRQLSGDILDSVHDFMDSAKCTIRRKKHSLNPFLVGGVLGSMLGGISGIILSPKTGQMLREHIAETYESMSDHTLELINSLNTKGEELKDLLASQTDEWAEKSLEQTEKILEEVHLWAEELREAALEAREQAEELGSVPGYREKIDDILQWSDKAEEVANEISDEVKEWVESFRQGVQSLKMRSQNSSEPFDEERASSQSKPNVNDLIEWAALGINLWQSLKHKKR